MSGDGGRKGNFAWYSWKEAALRLHLGVWHPGLPRAVHCAMVLAEYKFDAHFGCVRCQCQG